MENKFSKYIKFVIIIPIILILAFIIFTSFYTVGETERAVITTFGKVTAVKEAGLQFKLPYPIQDVYKVDMTTRKITIGYETNKNSDYIKEEESRMITGDFNVVSVDFFMEWKVTDPQKYLFNSRDPQGILKTWLRLRQEM